MKQKHFLKIGLIVLMLAGKGILPSALARAGKVIVINPEDVINTFPQGVPLGINMNFYEDNDRWFNPPRSTAAALKEMGVKFLRYPGGGKSDYYFFSKPPFSQAIPTMLQTGPGSNAARANFYNADRTDYKHEPLNFDDFMQICEETGAEPVIVCAIDTYIITPDKMPGSTSATTSSSREDYLRNAVEWVRYANVTHHYNVKYWILGNETENCYYKDKNGKGYGYTPEMYGKDIVEFSAAMKAVDPTIKLISNGADWVVKGYIANAADSIDFLACSNYPLSQTPYASYDEWVQKKRNQGDLVKPMEKVLDVVDACPTLSDAKKQSLRIIASEFSSATWFPKTWSSSDDLGHALFDFDIFGQTLGNPRFLFACFWNTRWETHENHSAYNALTDQNEFTPQGQSLALWGNYFLPKLIRTTQVDHVVSYATCSEDNHEIYYYAINQDPVPRELLLAVAQRGVGRIVKVAELSGKDVKSSQTNFSLTLNEVQTGIRVILDPNSVTVYHLSLH